MRNDVIVIGGGQSGLAAAYQVRQRGGTCTVLEASARIGDGWRARYASLTLFTPRSHSALPGLPLPGDPDGYAGRDEFADYLESYAKQFGLQIITSAPVARLTHNDRLYTATLADARTYTAPRIVVATGAFAQPVVPALADGFAPAVAQLTTTAYRSPVDLPAGTILVVGDGASGRDIAMDLVSTHRTLLATGKSRRLLPERVLGRSIWAWLSLLGLMRAGPDSVIGRIMRRADPFPDRNRSLSVLAKAGVVIKPRLQGAVGKVATFGDGSTDTVDAIVWAVGYRDNLRWIQIEGALDEKGAPRHRGGVSPVPGLYFLGRAWQRNRASALIMGAGEDARVIVNEALAPAPHR